MYQLLTGLRIVEGASFVAAPSCALHLVQLGAEVIRFDAIGGGPDFHRWPRAGSGGASLYWEGLNKGKKSVALDLSRPEGRELALALATAPGPGAGIFLTNYPAGGFLAHERLAARRPDMITVRVMGWADGTQAVDYTVNAAVGLPAMTGPADGLAPVNHVLPAWDLLAGATAAYALLAAERRRRDTGEGGEVRVPLGDLAMATLGHLGQVAEVATSGADRLRMGNELFGAFGRDFLLGDGERIMLVAITPRQWTGLVEALGLGAEMEALQAELGVTLAADEGVRFVHRARLYPPIEAALASLTLAQAQERFEPRGVCWSRYRTLKGALETDPGFSAANPIFAEVAHPSGARYLTPGAAATFTRAERLAPPRAPRLGEHTNLVLSEILGLAESEIARLHDRGLVAQATA